MDHEEARKLIRRAEWALSIVSAVTLLFSAWASIILPRHVIRPLVSLREAVDHAATGKLELDSNSMEVVKSWNLQRASKTSPHCCGDIHTIGRNSKRLKAKRRRSVINDKKNQYSQDDLHHPYLTSSSRTPHAAFSGISRRGFLGFAAAPYFLAHVDRLLPPSDARNGVPYRTLGRSREKVSLIGLGGYHLGKQPDPQESIRIIRTGLDEGINFLDNCWDQLSTADQVRKCREYAVAHGLKVNDDHVFVDEAVSGVGSDRVALGRMMNAAVSGAQPFDAVLYLRSRRRGWFKTPDH
jgi:hypothetical protein